MADPFGGLTSIWRRGQISDLNKGADTPYARFLGRMSFFFFFFKIATFKLFSAMQTKHHHKKIRSRQDAGPIALITSLLLMFLMSSLLVGFCILLISNHKFQ